jgi:hypothetical protein
MSEEFEFIKEFDCIGKWWLPEKDEEQLCGALKFDSVSGGKLEVVLQPGEHIDLSRFKDPVTLLGHTDIGDITLFDCRLSKSNASAGALSNETFVFNEGVIGAHISNMDNILIRNLKVNFSYLNKWSDSFGVSIGEVMIPFFEEKEEFSFKFPQPLLLAKGEGHEIYLEARLEKSFSFTDTSKQVAFNETPYINISLPGENTFKDYQEFVKSIQYFLTLAVREQVFLLIVAGEMSDSKPLTFFSRLPSIPVSESLLIANLALSDIQENIKEYLQNWLNNKDKLNPICELYFSSLNKNFNPELRFSYLIQAVEGFHRSFYENSKYMTDKEYRKKAGLYETLISVIPGSVTPYFGESIKDRLRYANEHELRERLKEMLSDTCLEIINIRGTIVEQQKRDALIGKIVRTRDYYAHQEKSLEDRILKDEELERAIKLLTALVEIILMDKMGIEVEKIKELRKTFRPL